MNKAHLLVVCLLLLMLGSCMTPREVNYLQKGRSIPQYVDTIGFSDYLLQRGDYLYVKVFSMNKTDMETFNGQGNQMNFSQVFGDNANSRLYLYLIEEDGCIDYPFVGRVLVEGKNLRQVKLDMEAMLAEMMTLYSVEVRLANKTFSVIGESRTGRYVMNKEKLTIFEALAMSGDLDYYANRREIHVIRQTDKGTEVYKFDLRSESVIDSEYYYIQPNDVIYIPFSDSRFVGANNFSGTLSLIFSTVSFGLLIYSLIVKFSG